MLHIWIKLPNTGLVPSCQGCNVPYLIVAPSFSSVPVSCCACQALPSLSHTHCWCLSGPCDNGICTVLPSSPRTFFVAVIGTKSSWIWRLTSDAEDWTIPPSLDGLVPLNLVLIFFGSLDSCRLLAFTLQQLFSPLGMHSINFTVASFISSLSRPVINKRSSSCLIDFNVKSSSCKLKSLIFAKNSERASACSWLPAVPLLLVPEPPSKFGSCYSLDREWSCLSTSIIHGPTIQVCASSVTCGSSETGKPSICGTYSF